MKLYKYKSFIDFEFTADILINRRLYASHFKELNDPMEGDFSPDSDLEYNKLVEKEMNLIRVCSLSKGMSSTILWAHYADGFKGICIEIDINDSIIEAHKINYGPFNPVPFDNYRGMHGNEEIYSPRDWAKAALTGKYEEWEYENEYRLFSNSKYIDNGLKITAVYLGTRISKTYEDILKRIIDEDIKIIHTEIDPLNGVKRKES